MQLPLEGVKIRILKGGKDIMKKRLVYYILMVFCFFILACGGGGGGENLPSNTPPEAPKNVVSISGNGQVGLSWENAVGATTYHLYWSTTAGVNKQTGTKIPDVSSIYYHTGLTNGTTYYYVVTAANQYGESGESQEVSSTPSASEPPLPPSNVAVLAGDGQVIIRWTAEEAGSGITSHNIYWSTSAGVTKQSGNKISGATNPYTHQDLTNGVTYYYAVSSVSEYGEGLLSAEVSATPYQSTPSAPSGVTATAGNRQAVIRWTTDPEVTSYNLYWSTSSNISSNTGTKIANVTSPYTHEGLLYDRTYYYVVTAVNAYGESEDSTKASVMIPNYLRDVCVAMGDSITAGTVGVDYANSYVMRLSRNWGKAIYNEGVIGALSSYGASTIDGVLAEYNPKYLTIFYGNNDDGFYDVNWIIGNLRYMIQRAKAYGTKPVIATLTPVFGDWAWRKPSEIILNQRIRQLASEQGITCADLEAAFGWNASYIGPDGLHPNSEGHRIIAGQFQWALTH